MLTSRTRVQGRKSKSEQPLRLSTAGEDARPFGFAQGGLPAAETAALPRYHLFLGARLWRDQT